MASLVYTKDMKRIPLTGPRGGYALVDDEDFEWLNQWKWSHNPRHYATRSIWVRLERGKFKHTNAKMHRLINNTPKGMDTDHINGNGLDNRRKNLRACTHAQNTRNRIASKRSKSGHRGVVWRPNHQDYVAYINIDNKRISLKTHKTLDGAVAARRAAEIKYHGEYARERG